MCDGGTGRCESCVRRSLHTEIEKARENGVPRRFLDPLRRCLKQAEANGLVEALRPLGLFVAPTVGANGQRGPVDVVVNESHIMEDIGSVWQASLGMRPEGEGNAGSNLRGKLFSKFLPACERQQLPDKWWERDDVVDRFANLRIVVPFKGKARPRRMVPSPLFPSTGFPIVVIGNRPWSTDITSGTTGEVSLRLDEWEWDGRLHRGWLGASIPLDRLSEENVNDNTREYQPSPHHLALYRAVLLSVRCLEHAVPETLPGRSASEAQQSQPMTARSTSSQPASPASRRGAEQHDALRPDRAQEPARLHP